MNMEEALAALRKKFPSVAFDMGTALDHGITSYRAGARDWAINGFSISIERAASPMMAYTRMLRICTAATKDA